MGKHINHVYVQALKQVISQGTDGTIRISTDSDVEYSENRAYFKVQVSSPEMNTAEASTMFAVGALISRSLDIINDMELQVDRSGGVDTDLLSRDCREMADSLRESIANVFESDTVTRIFEFFTDMISR